MAEIIPSLNKQVLSRMTAGERRLAQRFKDLLEDDYLCWYDIPIGKQQRYPDFILLHPARGLLFLEVKDWKAETIKKINKEQVELATNQGRKTVANPFAQVRQYAYQAINQLKRDPQLQQASRRYEGNLVAPYGWGVVFTNISRKTIEKGIPEEQRANLLPDHLMLYKDEMTESADAEAFQERLWGMFTHRFNEMLTVPQIDRIRWHLFPEIRIDAPSQDDLFGDNDIVASADANTAAAQVVPDIVRIMDIQQEQLARSLGEGHRVIHGVAGSGKTLILGYRAQMLAQTSSEPILILCFNVTLAAKLRSLMVAKGLAGQVLVQHFHDWCGAQLKTYQVEVIKGDEPVWERQVSSVIHGVETGQIPRAQYGAVLIDEGHDFEAQWLQLITQMVNPETNALLLLYDDAQSIYKKTKGLGFSLSSVGIQAQGRTTILKLNYRNTREILDFAYRFVGDYLDDASTSDGEGFNLVTPEAAGLNGPKPEVFSLTSWQEELAHCLSSLQAWREEGVAWRDMAVIYVAGFQGKAIASQLKQLAVPNLWMASKSYKQAYNPSEDKVAVMTLQSSKGLEFERVILLGLGAMAGQDVSQDAKLLYVGMTRAQQRLCICSSGKSELCLKVAEVAA